MNHNLDLSNVVVDDQHKQFIFQVADSSTVSLTFDNLAELSGVIHRIDEELAHQHALSWQAIKVYRNSTNIPVDVEVVGTALLKAHISYQIEDSVHPEHYQVQQQNLAAAITIINRLGYETDKDAEIEA